MPYSEQRPLKVLVTGACEAGKIRFLDAVCDREPLPTNVAVRATAPGTPVHSVDMKLGGRRLNDGRELLLFATSAPERSELVRDVLDTGVSGVVFVVDSTRLGRGLDRSRWMLGWYRRTGREIPLVVCADKQDMEGAAAPDVVRRALSLEENACVVGTSVERATESGQALQALLCQVDRETDAAEQFFPEVVAL